MEVWLVKFQWIGHFEAEVTVRYQWHTGWWLWKKYHMNENTYFGAMGHWRNVMTGAPAQGDVLEFCERVWYMERRKKIGSR